MCTVVVCCCLLFSVVLWGHDNRDFFGPWNGFEPIGESHLGHKKVKIVTAPPSYWIRPPETHYSQGHYNYGAIGNFMYMSPKINKQTNKETKRVGGSRAQMRGPNPKSFQNFDVPSRSRDIRLRNPRKTILLLQILRLNY